MTWQPFNQLTPAEAERLALLAEEMGEALQAIGKVLRHGYESYHPAHPEGPSNRQALTREVGDVYAAVCLMCKQGDLMHVEIAERVVQKQEAVQQYLHEQLPRESGRTPDVT
jgi:NTP pyrophosphatase (non-canonical NTP hydrolase)